MTQTDKPLSTQLARYEDAFGEPFPLAAIGTRRAPALIYRALQNGSPLARADLPRPPQLVAHRGYAYRYPENTLEAIAAAVNAGVDFLEFDIQLTNDRVPVLLHDETLQRMAGRAESIFSLSAVQATAVVVNGPASGPAGTARIPRLSQVVEALSGWPGVTAFVEIKRHSLQAFGVEETVTSVLEDLQPLQSRCVLISFDVRALETARRLSACRVGWVVPSYDPASESVATGLGPEFLFCNYLRLPPEPTPLWAGPWQWVCYEVTDADLAWRLARRGVRMIETMQVAELLAALRGAVQHD